MRRILSASGRILPRSMRGGGRARSGNLSAAATAGGGSSGNS